MAKFSFNLGIAHVEMMKITENNNVVMIVIDRISETNLHCAAWLFRSLAISLIPYIGNPNAANNAK